MGFWDKVFLPFTILFGGLTLLLLGFGFLIAAGLFFKQSKFKLREPYRKAVAALIASVGIAPCFPDGGILTLPCYLAIFLSRQSVILALVSLTVSTAIIYFLLQKYEHKLPH